MSTQETFVFPLEFNRLSLSQEDWIKGYRRLDDPHLGRQAAQKQHSYKNISQTNKSNNSHSQNRRSTPWHSAHTALRIFYIYFFFYSATSRKFLQLDSSIRKQVMTRHLLFTMPTKSNYNFYAELSTGLQNSPIFLCLFCNLKATELCKEKNAQRL